MGPLSGIALALAIAVSSSVGAQTSPSQGAPPQTARQALIEMFFGDAPNHLEKHLPDVTRQTLEKLGGANGQGAPGLLSFLKTRSKDGKEQLETFDTGPIFLKTSVPLGGSFEKTEITVERDDLLGDGDQIELAVHVYNDGKEETLLPKVLRLLFFMKMEAEIWRLNEVGANLRFPLADPAFLKDVEEHQLLQNEQMAHWSVRAVVNAEKQYQAAQGSYACKLSALMRGDKGAGGSGRTYLYDSQVATGKKNGYTFAILDCDESHYRIVAEPEAQGYDLRAYCADESGTLRSASDGKGATCVASGEVVEDKSPFAATQGVLAPATSGSAATSSGATSSGATWGATAPPGERVRVAQGVAEALIVSKVQPDYPPLARQARIQGQIILKAQIDKKGDIVSLELVSGHPMLAPAAIDAVKQWKYKPYLLNGKAVAVETQITVNFALSEH